MKKERCGTCVINKRKGECGRSVYDRQRYGYRRESRWESGCQKQGIGNMRSSVHYGQWVKNRSEELGERLGTGKVIVLDWIRVVRIACNWRAMLWSPGTLSPGRPV